MTKLERIMEILKKSIVFIYGFSMIGIILICIFLSKIEYYCSLSDLFLPDFILLLLGTFLLLSIIFVISKIKWPKIQKKYLLLLFIFITMAEIYAVFTYRFQTGWDSSMVTQTSTNIVHGSVDEKLAALYSSYYSSCPNNLFLVCIYSSIMKISDMIGLHAHEDFIILCVQCLLNTLTGALVLVIMDEITKNKNLIIFSGIVYGFLVVLSPWVSIPYSDSMGLIFPVAILCLYLKRGSFKLEWVPWFIMGILTLIGYKIKPQCAIVFIAIVIKSIISKNNFKNKLSIVKIVLALGIGILGANAAVNVAISQLPIEINKESTLGIAHYFMMGLNSETDGVFFAEDAGYSRSIETSEQRNKADMELAINRLKKMGISGLIEHSIKKTLVNYNDGTFCWGGEGHFFQTLVEEKNVPFNTIFRKMYYAGSDIGEYYKIWANFEHMIWLTILFLGIFSIFNIKDSNILIIMLSIVGLTLFQTLFEARARYLYIYAPFYIMLCSLGVQNLFDQYKKIKSNIAIKKDKIK